MITDGQAPVLWQAPDVNKLRNCRLFETNFLALLPSSAREMRPVSISQLLYGSAALSVASASFWRTEDEDDTPLPLVIWHGTSWTSPNSPFLIDP